MSPFDRSKYPPDWEAISRRIRERDGDRCRTCGVANGALVERPGGKVTRVVLTVAHVLNPDPQDCRDENLSALCQRCHLALDALQHLANAAATRRRRRARAGQLALPLLTVVA